MNKNFLWFIIGRLKQKVKTLEYYSSDHIIYCSNWYNFESMDNCPAIWPKPGPEQMETQDYSRHYQNKVCVDEDMQKQRINISHIFFKYQDCFPWHIIFHCAYRTSSKMCIIINRFKDPCKSTQYSL